MADFNNIDDTRLIINRADVSIVVAPCSTIQTQFVGVIVIAVSAKL